MGLLPRNVSGAVEVTKQIPERQVVRRTEIIVEREFVGMACGHSQAAADGCCPHCGQALPALLPG